MILREYQTGIGWAVDYESGGERHTLYFPTQPTSTKRDEMIGRYDQLQLVETVAKYNLEREES